MSKLRQLLAGKGDVGKRLRPLEIRPRWLLLTAWVCLIAAAVWYELTTSQLQARYLASIAARLEFHVESGPSDSIRFPKSGPYDERLGYTRIPEFSRELTRQGYVIEEQARLSRALETLTSWGFFPTYEEKSQTGLRVRDRDGDWLYAASYPERVYPAFDSIPPLVVDSLLFIENRELLDPNRPNRNPAVEWDRLAKAALDLGLRTVDKDRQVPGGSTLSTQLEKMRHSPEGRTESLYEKFRQMSSASLRAYHRGQETLESQRMVVVDYINSVPLAAAPGYGEVFGLGDGLWAWYGADFESVNRLVAVAGKEGEGETEETARAYKQVLSLFLAHRRPSFYLLRDPSRLEAQTNRYLQLLARAGVISESLRNAALEVSLSQNKAAPRQPRPSFIERKAGNAIRNHLLETLKLPSLYELDRLDLEVDSSLDQSIQEDVGTLLKNLRDPAFAEAAGLRAFPLSDQETSGVVYSLILYEHVDGKNLLRVHTDNLDQPFSINEGTKLELGSTAKLRTLVHYLEVIAELYERYHGIPAEELRAISSPQGDRLRQWVLSYLAEAPEASLSTLMVAAMERRYSANPQERFFTGGGSHSFTNFNREDDGKILTVSEAFRSSVNLVFIRIMRDIVNYHIYDAGDSAAILADGTHPDRAAVLSRFADREGRDFLGRFYRKYRGKNPEEVWEELLRGVRMTPERLAAIFRYVAPSAEVGELAVFARRRLPDAGLSEKTIDDYYRKYAPGAYDLADMGYLGGVHPLELWLVKYIRQHPEASLREVQEASTAERQSVYLWLFKTRDKRAQDLRIQTMLEVEAFQAIHAAWRKLGYPFGSLVPSLATAIGSSADRPASLAELVGVIVNGGVRYPSFRIEALRFAENTPYETFFRSRAPDAEPVLRAEIASVVKEALVEVVENGTARRARGAFVGADGHPIPLGGKTGTGDNRYQVYGPGGRLLESRVMNRTATFAFVLGDRFFGVATAFVAGPEAAHYRFTSALAVQLLQISAPSLLPLVDRAESGGEPG